MPEEKPKGFFKSTGHWIKKHPLAAAVIGVVIGVFVYFIVTNSQAQTGNASPETAGNIPANSYPDIYIVNTPGASSEPPGGPPIPNPTTNPTPTPTKKPTKRPTRKHPIIHKQPKKQVSASQHKAHNTKLGPSQLSGRQKTSSTAYGYNPPH